MRVIAGPLAQRRAELEDQLERVEAALSADSAARRSPLLVDLGPLVSKGVTGQLNRLRHLSGTPEQQWATLSDVSVKAQRLASETLAFLGGVAVRGFGLDGGACDLADVLLRRLARDLEVERRFVTLPASSEYIDVLSEVVRIRYPGNGIWDLPVALHEFGHYLVPRIGLRRGQPVQAVIDRERGIKPFLGAFAEELFCDVLATYVGGPAYGFCLAARLDPSTADRDNRPTHPSPAKRMTGVLLTLDALQAAWTEAGGAGGNLEELRDDVAASWERRVRSARPGVACTSADAWSTGLTTEFLTILDADDACLNRRFDEAAATLEVSVALQGGGGLPDRSFLAVLNGAWAARRAKEHEGRADLAPDIAATVIEAWSNMIGGGPNEP
jgi:hypothetical protein